MIMDQFQKILINLSNYAEVPCGFAYDLFEDFEGNKEIAYTFVNSLNRYKKIIIRRVKIMNKKALTLTVVANMTSNYSEGLGNVASVQKCFKTEEYIL